MEFVMVMEGNKSLNDATLGTHQHKYNQSINQSNTDRRTEADPMDVDAVTRLEDKKNKIDRYGSLVL